MKYKPSKRVFSAYLLKDDETWNQPSFRIIGPRSKDAVIGALSAASGAFAIFGLAEDPDAPERNVHLLDTQNRKWIK